MTIYDDVVTACDLIVDRLKGFFTPRGVAVFLGYAGEAQEWPLVNGVLVPTAIVDLPNLSHWRGATGITGYGNSMQELRFNVLNVAAKSSDAMKTLGIVCDLLVGWSPIASGGEIRLIGTALGNPTPQTPTPTRYAIPVGFYMPIGATMVS